MGCVCIYEKERKQEPLQRTISDIKIEKNEENKIKEEGKQIGAESSVLNENEKKNAEKDLNIYNSRNDNITNADKEKDERDLSPDNNRNDNITNAEEIKKEEKKEEKLETTSDKNFINTQEPKENEENNLNSRECPQSYVTNPFREKVKNEKINDINAPFLKINN